MSTPPPLPPDPGGDAPPRGTPWERREQIGFFPALVETTQQALTGPEAFFREMAVTGGIVPPLFYGVAIGYVGLVASTLYSLAFQVTMGGLGTFVQRSGPLHRLAPFLEGGVSLVANLILGPVFLAVGLFIWSGIVHLMLLVLGGARRDFEATFRAIGYSQAASIIQVIPLCGSLIGGIYGLVLMIIGVSHAHGISKGQAAAAVLVPLLVVCCCCAAGFGLAMGGLATALRQMR
jgi:hypothetical protein